jgi:hypothetical protein
VRYTLTNPTAEARTFRFAVEMNACVSAGDAPGRLLLASSPDEITAQYSLEEMNNLISTGNIAFHDEWLGVELRLDWDNPTTTWTFPVNTPMRSLEGFEWVYQSTVILPMWEIALPAGGQWSMKMRIATAMKMAAVHATEGRS